MLIKVKNVGRNFKNENLILRKCFGKNNPYNIKAEYINAQNKLKT